jgi:hypothetical protein
MDRWIDGSMDRWIDGSMDRWIDGSMDRWIDGRRKGARRRVRRREKEVAILTRVSPSLQ